MFYITKENVDDFLLGSVFLGTGGGLPVQEHARIFDQCLTQKKELCVKECNEFDTEEYFATVYGVGDPSQAVNIYVEELVRKSFDEYQDFSGITIRGIIPGEIGAEGLAFQAATYLGLPVVDSDLVGGRAAPEIQMDCFTVFGLPITPVMGIALNGKSIFLQGNFSSIEVEEVIRPFLAKNGGTGILIGYPVQAGIYAQKGMQGTLSRAEKIGFLLKEKDVDSMVAFLGATVVVREKLLSVDLESKDGFLQGLLTFEQYKIRVKNEHMALIKEDTVVVQVPDLLVLLSDSCTPIHNTDIGKYVGSEILIVHIPAQGYWSKEKNRDLWKTVLQ